MARATGNSRDGTEQPARQGVPVQVVADVARSADAHLRRTRKAVLSVIIINYCQWTNTSRLVRQLRNSHSIRSGSAQIVIIDNHSPRHPLAQVLARHRDVQVHISQRNEGFAKAVNRGAAMAEGDWVLLLNPDVTLSDSTLDQILASANKEPEDVGVIGFQLRNPDGSRQASCGSYPTLGSSLIGLFRPRSIRKCRHHASDQRQEVAWATGGCLLIRRKCFEQLNGLDESFFLYYEDVDFCRRAAELGWVVCYEPRITVIHHWPLHLRSVPAPLRLITRHALLTYARKHWTGAQQFVLAKLIALEAIFREHLANFAGDRASAAVYRDLRALAGMRDRAQWGLAQRMIYAVAESMRPFSLANDNHH